MRSRVSQMDPRKHLRKVKEFEVIKGEDGDTW